MPAPFSVRQANAGREQPPLHYQQEVNVAVLLGITPAQLNAGFNIIGPHQARIRVVDYLIVINGAAIGAVTDIRLGTTATTPVVITTIAQANAIQDARFTAKTAATGQTFGAGLFTKLAQGSGVQIYKTGSAATGAFTIDVLLWYDVVS